MSSQPPRLLLVDGHYYLYRSFYAIRGLSNSRGEPTNAIYGFVKALRRMLSDLKPDYAAVVWDAGLPERRTQLQPDYKQHRDEMPDELDVQQEPIQEIVPLMGVASVFLENHEADDLIASYVTEARKTRMECVVATNDKDILQLVGDGVTIYSTAKADVGEGNGGFKLLGVEEVRAKWGVDPALIADVLALTGDSADNIPGVPGVGGKTAAKWINQYGSLDRILKGDGVELKVIEKIGASREQIASNRAMVALDLDLPLPLPVERMRVNPDYPKLIEALRACEFRSLTAEVEREMEQAEKLKNGNAESLKAYASDGGKPEAGNQQSVAGDQKSEIVSRGSKDEIMGRSDRARDVESPCSQPPATNTQVPTQGELFA